MVGCLFSCDCKPDSSLNSSKRIIIQNIYPVEKLFGFFKLGYVGFAQFC